MYRAALALNIAGDPAATIVHAERAFDRAAEDDHLVRAAASALSGLASWTTGDLATAHDRYVVALDGLERAGHIADVLGCAIAAGDLELTLGRLDDAHRTFERALELAEREDPVLRGTADMLVGLSRVALERNDLAVATDHLRRAEELGDSAELPQNPYRWRVALARLRAAQGDPDVAWRCSTRLSGSTSATTRPTCSPCRAARAGCSPPTETSPAALAWAQQHRPVRGRRAELSPRVRARDPGEDPARPAGHRTVHVPARSAAVAAEDGGRVGTVIEILALQALAQRRRRVPWSERAGARRAPRVGPGLRRRGRADADAARDPRARPPDSAYLQRILDAATTVPRPVPSASPGPASSPSSTRSASGSSSC